MLLDNNEPLRCRPEQRHQQNLCYSFPIPESPTPNRLYCPEDVFFIYPPPPVTVWFTVLSLFSCKRVDFTRIAPLFASGHVSSSLPVTFDVVLVTDLLWYVQYARRQLLHLHQNTLATMLLTPAPDPCGISVWLLTVLVSVQLLFSPGLTRYRVKAEKCGQQAPITQMLWFPSSFTSLSHCMIAGV